jgi:hypothetical protein
MKRMLINVSRYTLICFAVVFSFSTVSVAQNSNNSASQSVNLAKPLLTLEIIDPFVEMRTGPGRGYPIFYVAEQGETVEVLVRRAGWYEIKAQNGKVGWATPAQLSRTLQATGEPADLPSVSFGDYLKNKWRVGFTSGDFSDGQLKGSDIFAATLSYRFLSWLSVEGRVGKLFNSQSDGDLRAINVLFEPFSKNKLSPEVFIGRGVISLDNQPRQTEVIGEGDSNFLHYGLGLNYYLGRNFVIRGEYGQYSVSEDGDKEKLDSWKIGFNTFF